MLLPRRILDEQNWRRDKSNNELENIKSLFVVEMANYKRIFQRK
jgi:hypothetical protein